MLTINGYQDLSTHAHWNRKNASVKAANVATILVKNLETLVCIFPSPMLIWALQRSQCFKIRVAQHLGRERAYYSENKFVRSKSQQFSRKFKTSGVCFKDFWRGLWGIYWSRSPPPSPQQLLPISHRSLITNSWGGRGTPCDGLYV